MSEPDNGQADAINRGFNHSTGEDHGRANWDHMYLPGALQDVARYFAAHPDVDVVYGKRLMIDALDVRSANWMFPNMYASDPHAVDDVPQETLFWRRSIW